VKTRIASGSFFCAQRKFAEAKRNKSKKFLLDFSLKSPKMVVSASIPYSPKSHPAKIRRSAMTVHELNAGALLPPSSTPGQTMGYDNDYWEYIPGI
jgi:hypothetical protein